MALLLVKKLSNNFGLGPQRPLSQQERGAVRAEAKRGNFIRKLHASCSGVLTSGFSGEIGALAVHPIGATAANGTALRETVGANTALDEGLKFGLVTRTNERTNIG